MSIDAAPTASGRTKPATGSPPGAGSTGVIEQEIRRIWEDVLKTKDFSRTDDFFDLGGTSLDLIRIFGQINEKYDLSLDGSVLEDDATLASLAGCIQSATHR